VFDTNSSSGASAIASFADGEPPHVDAYVSTAELGPEPNGDRAADTGVFQGVVADADSDDVNAGGDRHTDAKL
jgi:hypothetical protein